MDYSLTLPGNPVTKKNSQRILKNKRTGASFVAPSNNYVYYRNCCIIYLHACVGLPYCPINYPVNVQVLYYMDSRRRVDLVNLLEGTCDILVDAGILEDDNSNIVAGHDGSRVLYDKLNPRCEILITKVVS